MSVQPDRKWEVFAEREPFFAVFTDPKFLSANRTANQEREFFDSGELLVDSIFHTIRKRLTSDFAPESVLEYGCGPGRLAIPFARRSGSVTAVDRSPAMLAVARREAAKQNVGNIHFKTAAEFAPSARKFDLVNSYLLFQRLPPSRGLVLFRELVGRIGSGGVGVFHFLCRGAASRGVRLTRAMRERAAVVNGIVNIARQKPFGEPFIPSHAYDLDEVFRILVEAGFENSHVAFEDHEEMTSAILFVQAPHSFAPADRDIEPASIEAVADAMIDVRELIARTSIDDLNRTAEEYFSSLTEWEHHLAKPFAKPDEAPPILIGVATLLQGLRLVPGMTVLEFGAGTGWLSRFLTQLGCRVILLDVSATALRIARDLYERQPPIGERPAPHFLEYDGRRIELADESVERIVCFDAFHHAPNPDDVLREFGRVLTPGGIAAFAEPGPRHSRTPLSQFEMRTYGVVENDIDINALWRTAQSCGFRDLKLALFHAPPFHVSLDDYEDLLAGGATAAKWAAATRTFLRDVRTFFLFKEGSERIDSRSPSGLAADVAATLIEPVFKGRPIIVDAVVTNRGTATWLPSDAQFGGVALGAHLHDVAGKLITFDLHWERLTEPPREIAPGETVRVRMSLPPQPAGRYTLEIDCVAAGVAWFAQLGSRPAQLALEVAHADV
ncbi:MAG TPA: methyltransferase domain-containing protein [Thermoanaerobaculia bacterium]|jgi:SAM-dependent methyltransferase|nr:methyltransferase domain-containing protein [Thermoanaerobaculia bacterium]